MGVEFKNPSSYYLSSSQLWVGIIDAYYGVGYNYYSLRKKPFFLWDVNKCYVNSRVELMVLMVPDKVQYTNDQQDFGIKIDSTW